MEISNFRCLRSVALIIIVLFFTGCGGSMSGVSGKVAFDDGTPLTKGEVSFQTAAYIASGKIKPDGTYTISSLKENDGIPDGSYRVTVKAMEYSSSSDLNAANAKSGYSLVNTKFGSPDTSGLTCEVKGRTTFDITVEKPAK